MIVNQFHKLVAELELESILLTLQQFTEAFGALNWRENSVLETLANTTGQHPLKAVLTELAVWLDAYEQGSATVEAWLAVMEHAGDIQRLADGSVHDFNNRFNPRWQAAKAAAQSVFERDLVNV